MARTIIFLTTMFLWLVSLGDRTVQAQDKQLSWIEVKCIRYNQAWSEFVKRKGTQGLSREFLAAHDAFLASGCLLTDDVCPRSPEEFEMANMMIIASYNAGMGSTFTPFACRKRN